MSERYIDIVKNGEVVGRKLIVDRPARQQTIPNRITNEEIAEKLDALEAKIDALKVRV